MATALPINSGVHTDQGPAYHTRAKTVDDSQEEQTVTINSDDMSELLLIPEPFKGTSMEDSMRFLSRLEAYAKYKNLNDAQQVGTFPLLLRDCAITWFENLPPSDTADMKELKKAFIERYGPQAHKSYHQVAELFQRTQRSGEKILDYISDMRRRAGLLKLPEPQTLQAILHGLNDTIRPFVLQNNPKDLVGLEAYAKIIGDAAPTAKPSTDTTLLAAVQQLGKKLDQLTTHTAISMAREPPKQNHGYGYGRGRGPGRGQAIPGPPHRRPLQQRHSQHQQLQQPAAPQQQPQPYEQSPVRPCAGCGGKHFRSTCPHREAQCYLCGKLGHISRVCRSARIPQQ